MEEKAAEYKKHGMSVAKIASMCEFEEEVFKSDRKFYEGLADYTENVFPFRKGKNNGQVEQYYYTDVHEPIIPRDVFETVQQLMAEKGEYFGNTEFHQYPLSMKIECSECSWGSASFRIDFSSRM